MVLRSLINVSQVVSTPLHLPLTYMSLGQNIDNSFDQFWEFADFLDGIGLPAEWSPYLQGPDFNESTASETSNHYARGSRLGTPFNHWLPSAPGADGTPSNRFDQGKGSQHRTLLLLPPK